MNNIDILKTNEVLGFLFCFSWLSAVLSIRCSGLLALAFLFFTVHGMVYALFPPEIYSNFQVEEIVGFESLILKAVLIFVVTSWTVHFLRTKTLERMFLFLAVVNAMAVTLLPGHYFIFNNPAVDGSFLACTLPFFLRDKKRFYSGLMILACVITGSSTAIVGVGIAISMYMLAKNKFTKKEIAAAALLLCSTAFSGYMLLGQTLFDSSGRYTLWATFFDFFKKAVNPWFGAGLGTFQMHGRGLLAAKALKSCSDLGTEALTNECLKTTVAIGFPTLHNEWLQVGFETGVVGLIVVLTVFTTAIYKLRQRPAEFASLVTFGCMAITQMPLRIFFYGMFGAFLIVTAFRPTKKQTSKESCENYKTQDFKGEPQSHS